MRIVLLHNEVSADSSAADLDVLVQRDAVTNALTRLGHETHFLACTLDLSDAQSRLKELRPDVVFNLVESLGGTDRLMPAATLLLDAMGLPYTGSPTRAMLITSDKVSTKQALLQAGLPTAPWFTRESSRWHGADARRSAETSPIRSTMHAASFSRIIVKAIWEHASFHMDDEAVLSLETDTELAERLASRELKTGQPHFAEAFLEGREFNLSVMPGDGGPEVLPPAEIDFGDYPAGKPRIVGYRAKWDEQSFEYHHTPRRFDFPDADAPLLDRLIRLAAQCWMKLQLRGYARVDFRVDGAGWPWILEVNANPCLSPDAGFAAAVERAGIPYDEAIRRIVHDAQTQPPRGGGSAGLQ